MRKLGRLKEERVVSILFFLSLLFCFFVFILKISNKNDFVFVPVKFILVFVARKF